ncbi:hypothetical protein B0T26DRAFT_636847 [Lasiosphaeria miniovina]|uniref:Uncharacterized protein n=1 Tax=Lasiosphaeria miniovina TaxID=1954250 RepID=A0AA40E991_9PEZI|nr:uncharacterized protein B0T26DRAFT_636847 [Lasiosphaeria miniovina]KAK0727068.1 hypothetical protein B0T26DRAFT_636847 [Lasiosphaeria miniovina]
MQRTGATPTQPAAAFFASLFSGGDSTSGGSSSPSKSHRRTASKSHNKSPSKSRPGTSSGDQQQATGLGSGTGDTSSPRQPNVLHKDRDRGRRPSFGRKASFSSSSPSKARRRADSSASTAPINTNTNGGGPGSGSAAALGLGLFDADSIPPVPEFTLAAAAKLSRETDAIASPASADSFPRMLNRTAPTPVNGFPASSSGQLAPPAVVAPGQPTELTAAHHQIQETANKRISTLDYLRKAHEGRVYWFNTLLFDKPDLARMPYFDSRKLARRATNYLLLGISLPTVIDLNSNTPLEFLRSLNTLLSEFESFQQLHSENGGSSSSLSRARIPQMFRRATPGTKGRRSSSATGDASAGVFETALDGSFSGNGSISSSSAAAAAAAAPASIINFASSEIDLLPGEEYTHLLTPTLPFDPDFFETFATLCDVLIDTYTRLLSLVPTPRECSGPVADLFAKADARVRKIIVQGIVKDFEDASRAGAKTEVANVGKVVLGGLM